MASGVSYTMCLACRHPLVADIDAALRDGRESNRAIARRFGLGRTSVDSHDRRGHVAPEPPGSGVAAAPIASDGTPLGDLLRDRALLDAIDTTKLSHSQAMSVFQERRRAAEAIAKLTPTPPPPEGVTITAFLDAVFEVVTDPADVKRLRELYTKYKSAKEGGEG